MRLFESKLWRLIGTAVSFTLFGCMAVVISISLAIALTIAPIKKKVKHNVTRHCIMLAARFYLGCLRGLGVLQIKFENMHLINQPGTLIIANHPTLLDAVLLMSVMPHANFVIKASVSDNPFISIIVSLAGYIPNNETGIALVKRASSALKNGETVMIFPEGTRTDFTQGMNFKRSAANIAIQADCLILPIIISCEPITLRKHEPWYSIPSRRPLFHLRALTPVHAKDCIDVTKPLGTQARELNAFLQNQIAKSFNDNGKPL